MMNKETDGTALNIRFDLGFFHLIFFPKIKLRVDDLKIAEATHRTIIT
jgi:hypothetical protein